MTKSELINKIGSVQQHLSEKDIALAVNAIIDLMIEAMLKKNGRIEIRDFGNFSLRLHAPRQAHNPKTGEALMTKSKVVVHFKSGKGMKRRVDASKDKPIIRSSEEEG